MGDLGCKNTPLKAECSKKVMFIDSHTQNSKNDSLFSEMQGFVRYMKKFDGAKFSQTGRYCN